MNMNYPMVAGSAWFRLFAGVAQTSIACTTA
jgi:hypothetical protein